MVSKLIAITVVLAFALIMWGITAIVKKKTGKDVAELLHVSQGSPKEEKEPHEKGFVEKYCNDQKNDSRRALANYILIHEDNERKKRGQIDD